MIKYLSEIECPDLDMLKADLQDNYEIAFGFYSVNELKKAIQDKQPAFVEYGGDVLLAVGESENSLFFHKDGKTFSISDDKLNKAIGEAIIVQSEIKPVDNPQNHIIFTTEKDNWPSSFEDTKLQVKNLLNKLLQGETFLPPHPVLLSFQMPTPQQSHEKIQSMAQGVHISLYDTSDTFTCALHEIGHVYWRTRLTDNERKAFKEHHKNLKPAAIYIREWETETEEEMFCTIYMWYLKSKYLDRGYFDILKYEDGEGLSLLLNVFDRIRSEERAEKDWPKHEKVLTEWLETEKPVLVLGKGLIKAKIKNPEPSRNIRVPSSLIKTSKKQNGKEIITVNSGLLKGQKLVTVNGIIDVAATGDFREERIKSSQTGTGGGLLLKGRDYSKLTKKIIVDKNGHQRNVYVRIDAKKESLKTSIKQFVQKALNSSENKMQRIELGDVTEAQNEDYKKMGFNFNGYKHTVDNYTIKHIIKEHGNEGRGKTRGQFAVKEEDFELIPDIIRNYDSVKLLEKRKPKELDTLQYIKEYDNKTYLFEEVRTGRKELAIKSLKKNKRKKRTDAAVKPPDSLVRNELLPYKNNKKSKETSQAKIDDSSKMTKADSIESAAKEVNTNPTEKQIEAGNYKKGSFAWNGLTITLENPKGSYRSGIAPDGKKWKSKIYHHYGYINRTEGNDGDHVDVFIGKHPEEDYVFVINQNNPKNGKFDEHKVMIGFKTEAEAKKAYLKNYEKDWKGLGSVQGLSVKSFKDWLKTGDMTKPMSINMQPKIYIDLDGVLTDFEKEFKKHTGQTSSEYVKDHPLSEMWDVINNIDHFWLNMNWTPEGKKLWNSVKEYNPILLSAPADRVHQCKSDKIAWVKREIGDVKLILDSDKGKYAESGAILVDDMDKNITSWNAAGGTAIKHTDVHKTIKEIRGAL